MPLTNQYLKTGVHLSPEEFEIVQMGLTSIASAAKEHGRPEIFDRSMALLDRLTQCVMAGKGVPEQKMEQFSERMKKAIAASNLKAMRRTIEEWIAALIRMEPDPAQSVAKYVTEIFLSHSKEQNTLRARQALHEVKELLPQMREGYPADMEEVDEIVEYLTYTLSKMEQEL